MKELTYATLCLDFPHLWSLSQHAKARNIQSRSENASLSAHEFIQESLLQVSSLMGSLNFCWAMTLDSFEDYLSLNWFLFWIQMGLSMETTDLQLQGLIWTECGLIQTQFFILQFTDSKISSWTFRRNEKYFCFVTFMHMLENEIHSSMEIDKLLMVDFSVGQK